MSCVGCNERGHMTALERAKIVASMPVGEVARGIVGMASESIGLDDSTPEQIAARLDICRNCDQSTRNKELMHRPSNGLTTRSRCLLCSCLLWKKVRWSKSRCKRGKW